MTEIDRGLDLLGYDEHGNYHPERDTTPEVKARLRWHRRHVSTQRLADMLTARGLRPRLDGALDLVRSECPDCRAGERDPLGLYRPLAAMTDDRGVVIVRCDFCGVRDV